MTPLIIKFEEISSFICGTFSSCYAAVFAIALVLVKSCYFGSHMHSADPVSGDGYDLWQSLKLQFLFSWSSISFLL